MNNKNNIGEFLKSLRVAKGLTQMELAELLEDLHREDIIRVRDMHKLHLLEP